MISRAALALAVIAAAGCIKPAPDTSRASIEDPCFSERDVAQDVAVRTGNPHSIERFRKVDALCEKRARILLAEAVKLRHARADRALELVERAIVIASKKGDALSQARDLREILLVETGAVDGASAPDVEAAAYLQDAAEYERDGAWSLARDALRNALSYGPNAEIQERLREAEERCRLEARAAIAEARVQEAAGEIDAAYESVDVALNLANPDSTEADEAYAIMDRLDAAANAARDRHRDTGVGDLPPDTRPPALDRSQADRMKHARHAESMDDWLSARRLWRELAEEYASDAEIQPALEYAEQRCLEIARTLIVESRAYEAAFNYAEANKLASAALRYADRSGPERDDAEKLLAKLRRDGSPAAPTYDVPPADAPLAALLRAGDVSVQRQDWLAAREIYRRALSTHPGDDGVAAKLETAHAECIRMARRQISEAKAYEAATNYPEALKALRLALLYADRPTDREYEQAKEIEARIRRGGR